MADLAEALLRALCHQALALSVAAAAVGVLRPLLRHVFGAQTVYLCWAAVPATGLAALLPVPSFFPQALRLDAGVWPLWTDAPGAAATGAAAATQHSAWLWLGPWLLGAALVMWWGALQQHRAAAALRRAQPVSPTDRGTHWRLAAGSSPALVGAWHPRLALPDDFTTRFDTAEQNAVLLHESVHRQRHDNRWNLLAFSVAALHWFNPLGWWALRRMRLDQEVACDAAVMSLPHGPTPAAYARALLKSQHLESLLPAASHWQSTHPLVERLTLLKRTLPTRRRLLAGRITAAMLGLLCLSAGHALQAEPKAKVPAETLAAAPATSPTTARPGTVMVYIDLDQDGVRFASPRLFGKLGRAMAVRWGANARQPQVEPGEVAVTVTEQADGKLLLSTTLKRGPDLQQVSQPRLVTAPGTTARIESRAAGESQVLGVSVRAVLAASPDTAPR